MCNVAYIAIKDERHIVLQPRLPSAGAGAPQRLGVAAFQDDIHQRVAHHGVACAWQSAAVKQALQQIARRAIQFGLGEWQQGNDFKPARQRVSHDGQGHEVGGAGQQEAARRLIFVNAFLDGQQEFGSALHFVNHGSAQTAHKTSRVGPRRCQRGRIVQRDVGTFTAGIQAGQRGLACLPRANYQHHARVL